jgi:hypothetical protein
MLFVKKVILDKPFKGRRKQMKKLSVLFSIFTVLMAVTFTSCTPEVSEEMDSFTEDMIGEWMIGTWDIDHTSKQTGVVNGEKREAVSKQAGTYEFKGIEDDSEIEIKVEESLTYKSGEEYTNTSEYKMLFAEFKAGIFEGEGTTEGIKNSITVNKERTRIEQSVSGTVDKNGVEVSITGFRTFTKR